MAQSEPVTQYPFSSPVPHHRLAHALVWLVLVVAILALASWFFFRPDSTITPTDNTDDLAIRRSLLLASNPPANLSAAEINSRKVLLSSSNPPSQLSAEEIERRMQLLNQ